MSAKTGNASQKKKGRNSRPKHSIPRTSIGKNWRSTRKRQSMSTMYNTSKTSRRNSKRRGRVSIHDSLSANGALWPPYDMPSFFTPPVSHSDFDTDVIIHYLPDSSRNPPLGTGRSHRASVSNGANSSIATGRNRPCQTVEPVSPVRHFGNIHAGAAGRPQEQHSESPEMSSSPGAISQGSMFDTRAIPIGGHPGPHRHQKLPSLSNILENRPDGGKLSMSSEGSVWGSRSVPGGSAVSHESMGPGGSPGSSASGYALSASETDRPLPFSSLLSNAETQPVMYRAEPPRQSQPLLAYAGYR